MGGRDVGPCRSCGASMLWVEMIGTGSRNPLDVEPSADGNVLVVAGINRTRLGLRIERLDEKTRAAIEADEPQPLRYRSHFETCPNRDQHRKDRTT